LFNCHFVLFTLLFLSFRLLDCLILLLLLIDEALNEPLSFMHRQPHAISFAHVQVILEKE
jgi:hypothetical protein